MFFLLLALLAFVATASTAVSVAKTGSLPSLESVRTLLHLPRKTPATEALPAPATARTTAHTLSPYPPPPPHSPLRGRGRGRPHSFGTRAQKLLSRWPWAYAVPAPELPRFRGDVALGSSSSSRGVSSASRGTRGHAPSSSTAALLAPSPPGSASSSTASLLPLVDLSDSHAHIHMNPHAHLHMNPHGQGETELTRSWGSISSISPSGAGSVLVPLPALSEEGVELELVDVSHPVASSSSASASSFPPPSTSSFPTASLPKSNTGAEPHAAKADKGKGKGRVVEGEGDAQLIDLTHAQLLDLTHAHEQLIDVSPALVDVSVPPSPAAWAWAHPGSTLQPTTHKPTEVQLGGDKSTDKPMQMGYDNSSRNALPVEMSPAPVRTVETKSEYEDELGAGAAEPGVGVEDAPIIVVDDSPSPRVVEISGPPPITLSHPHPHPALHIDLPPPASFASASIPLLAPVLAPSSSSGDDDDETSAALPSARAIDAVVGGMRDARAAPPYADDNAPPSAAEAEAEAPVYVEHEPAPAPGKPRLFPASANNDEDEDEEYAPSEYSDYDAGEELPLPPPIQVEQEMRREGDGRRVEEVVSWLRPRPTLFPRPLPPSIRTDEDEDEDRDVEDEYSDHAGALSSLPLPLLLEPMAEESEMRREGDGRSVHDVVSWLQQGWSPADADPEDVGVGVDGREGEGDDTGVQQESDERTEAEDVLDYDNNNDPIRQDYDYDYDYVHNNGEALEVADPDDLPLPAMPLPATPSSSLTLSREAEETVEEEADPDDLPLPSMPLPQTRPVTPLPEPEPLLDVDTEPLFLDAPASPPTLHLDTAHLLPVPAAFSAQATGETEQDLASASLSLVSGSASPSPLLPALSLRSVVAGEPNIVDEESEEESDENEEVDLGTLPRQPPAWSLRASDAPALGLPSSTRDILTKSPATANRELSKSPAAAANRELGADKENAGHKEKENLFPKSPPTPSKELVRSPATPHRDLRDEVSVPGAFPASAPFTSTTFAQAVADAVKSVSSPASTAIAPASTEPKRRRPPLRLDAALAMQLRPGLGAGADGAWLVRFLMSFFGWFAVLVAGGREFS